MELDTKKAARKGFHGSLPLCSTVLQVRTLPRAALPHGERIQALVERDEGLDGSAGVDARGTDQAGQQLGRHDGAVEEGTEERHLCTPKQRSRIQDAAGHWDSVLAWPHRFPHGELQCDIHPPWW